MAYATLSDIQDKLPNLVFGDPPYDDLKPTEAQVTEWLAEVSDNVLDPVVRTLITALPVTDAQGLAWLKQMAINWVCAEIYRSLEAESTIIDSYKKDFDKAMALMVKAPTILQDPQGGGSPEHFTPSIDEPLFKREGPQW